MNQNTLINLIEQEVKGLSSYLDANDYVNALSDACREIGWSLPTTTDFQIYWLKQRAKRHLLFYLQTEQAYKFKFEQINLQHRFDHLEKMVNKMDRDFSKAMEENPAEFANVDLLYTFGMYASSSISHNQYGEDTTQSEDNLVEFTPNETDG